MDPDPLEGHNRYVNGRKLAKGAFGFVYAYYNIETEEDVAIKFLERGEHITKYVEGEVLNHRILRHHHVIEFKEVFLTPEYICIAMEYASGGSLFIYVQNMGCLKEDIARWFFQQLILGIDYCHHQGIVNRDIKLENALLQPIEGFLLPVLKICDFGYSKAQVLSAPKSTVGTLAYMAPEVVRGEKYDGKLADIFSCGVLLFVMLYGRYPFDPPREPGKQINQRNHAMMMRMVDMRWYVPPGIPVSPECEDLLRRLIVADPARRLSMAEIQRHKWFLERLPSGAVSEHEKCLANDDFSEVQSISDIQKLLQMAGSVELPGQLEQIIDEEIREEATHQEAMTVGGPVDMEY